MKLKPLNNIKDAEKIIAFMYGDKAFHWLLSSGEKKAIKERFIIIDTGEDNQAQIFYEDVIIELGYDKNNKLS